MAQEGELDQGSGDDGEFVLLGSDGAAVFQPPDTSLDRIASSVVIRINGVRAGFAHVAAPGKRDGRPDAALPEVGED